MSIISDIFKSKGKKRTLSAILSALAVVAGHVPVLAPFQPILIQLAGVLGGIAVAHAAAQDNL